MTKATNDQQFAEAVARTQARKDALDALPPEAQSFLDALRDRWFPMGKTEDYALVQRLLVDAWVQP